VSYWEDLKCDIWTRGLKERGFYEQDAESQRQALGPAVPRNQDSESSVAQSKGTAGSKNRRRGAAIQADR